MFARKQRVARFFLSNSRLSRRFLRGNACDVDKSVTQFQEAKVIRGNLEADSAYNDVDLDEFEDARRMVNTAARP